MNKRKKRRGYGLQKCRLWQECVFWVNTRCLVVVRRQNTTRAAGRIGVGQYVLFVPAYGGDRIVLGQ